MKNNAKKSGEALKNQKSELDNSYESEKEGTKMSNMTLPVLSQDAGLVRYLDEIKKFPVLTEEEERDLAFKWHDEKDMESAQKLVTSHLRLVAKIAQQFRGYGLPVTDMISEGNVGLMIAVKKFDPNKGFRLATYAMWWIRATIQDYILKSWSMVKIGTSATQKKLFFNLKKIKNRLQHINDGQMPANADAVIASELNLPEDAVRDMNMRMSGGDLYLNSNAYGSDDDSGEVIDTIPASEESHENIILEDQEYNYKKDKFSKALSELNQREQDIIKERRLADKPATLEALGAKYGVSSERVRQIEEKALKKLTEAVGNN